MSCSVVAKSLQAAPYNFLKAVCNDNCDMGINFGRCYCPGKEESSSHSSEPNSNSPALCAMKAMGNDSTDNEEAWSVIENDSSSSPSADGKSAFSSSFSLSDRSGLERMGSGISAVSSDIINIPLAQGEENSCKKLPSSQYKGVVAQPNGRWGAQIYEKHHRVWLGTFNLKEDAARAYDRAAIKFRGAEAITNLKFDDSHPEAVFLRSHSKGEIVDMLRKHTYDEELDQNCNSTQNNISSDIKPEVAGSNPPEPREYLFDKIVTPSDVGKLNRLVIPKQHAEKYFPFDVASGGSQGRGVLLNFEDSTDKTWRFRYSYWNSSQSYVLTKGWSRFVKEKQLQAGDTVTFERTSRSRQLFISFRRRSSSLLPLAGPLPLRKRVQYVDPFAVAGYPLWAQFLYKPPPFINAVTQCSTPGRPSPNSIHFHDTKALEQTPSEDGNPFVFVNLDRASPSTVGDSLSSSPFRLFGVNLQRLPLPLNLFPGSTVEEEADGGMSGVVSGKEKPWYGKD